MEYVACTDPDSPVRSQGRFQGSIPGATGKHLLCHDTNSA